MYRLAAIVLLVAACTPPKLAPTAESAFVTYQSLRDVMASVESTLRDEGFDEIKGNYATGILDAHRKRMANEAGPQVRCNYNATAASTRDTDLAMHVTAITQGDSTAVTISSSVLATDQAPTALGVTRSRSRDDCKSSGTIEAHIRDSLGGRAKGS